MRTALLGVALCLAACHLAEDPGAPTCGPGTHLENGFCAGDKVLGPVITITAVAAPGGASEAGAAEAGAGCAVSPESITVAPDGEFSFKNEDSVDHVITGADGQTWATAKAGLASPLIGITRTGSWPFEVSGCAKGGTVIVQ